MKKYICEACTNIQESQIQHIACQPTILYYDMAKWIIGQVDLQTRIIINVGNLMLSTLCPNDVENMYKMSPPNRYLNDDFLVRYKVESANYFEKVERWWTINQASKTKSNKKYIYHSMSQRSI